MTAPGSPIRVLIVDDAPLFRRYLKRVLSIAADIEVIGEASSAEEARSFVLTRRPDVITLDLEMPGQGGLTFLRETIAWLKIPTLVISACTPRGAQLTIQALEAGAVDVIAKPRGLTAGQPDDVAMSDIVTHVRAAAQARPTGRTQTAAPRPAVPAHACDWVVALGASTGGVQALETVLQALPAGCPPVVIVQHMPEGFTGAFARRVNSICDIEVREAVNGDRLAPGLALIAPGGSLHMQIARSPERELVAYLVPGDPICFSRPSVDALFLSAAAVAAPRVSAALLTGMGHDGAKGLLALRRAGAQTFAQDEASSVVYGMPARAWDNGGAMAQVPLNHIADRLLASIGTTSASAAATSGPRSILKGL